MTETATAEHCEIDHPYLKESLKFTGIPGEWQTEQIRKSGKFYEQDLLDAMEVRLRRRSGIVIDVGACLGNHTLFFAAVLGIKVLAVEPSSNYYFLNKTVEENNLESMVDVVGIAASDIYGTLFCPMPTMPKVGSIALTALPSMGVPGDPVPAVPLDDLHASCKFSNIAPIGIKIDVEGMEPQVIAGASGLIERFQPTLAVECKREETKYIQSQLVGICEDKGIGWTIEGPYCATPTFIFHPDRLA